MDKRDETLERFEAAWHDGPAPALAAFLPPAPPGRSPSADPECVDLFHELVKVDLEYRWRSPTDEALPTIGALPRHPRLEDYVALLPGFGTLRDLPLDVVGEEYRVRQRWGDRPQAAEYVERFPELAPLLPLELARIERELLDERATLNVRGPMAPEHVSPTLPAKTPASVQCPHCRHSLHTPAAGAFREITCTACGGAFHLEALSAAPDRGAQPPFARLGRYELRDLLGAGAFGAVWRAWDAELTRDVALKLPRAGQVLGPADEERFLREARAAARLHHPGIVAVHDVGRDHDTLYLVSELVHGISLADWLKRRRFSFREAAQLIAQLADALDFAHRQGVVHRDVKPSNIMLESGDTLTPRLMDFGLALRNAGEITMTLDGQMLGTPAYVSPEQLRNPHGVDGRSDVYSLGVILYELLTGELPFRGMTRMVLDQVLFDEPQPPRRLNDRISRDLETICLKCLVKEPGGRYQSAASLASDLRRWLDGRPIVARPTGWGRRGWLWVRRRPATAIVGSMVAVALAAVLGVSTSLIVLGLMTAAVVSLFVALRQAATTGELSATVGLAVEDQQKTAAALQYALQNCLQAREERDRAIADEALAARRFDLLRGLAKAWIFELPKELERPGDTVPTRAFLVKTALAYLDGLAKEAGDDAALLREAAVAYGRVGDLQAKPPQAETQLEADAIPAVGDLAGALATYRKSLELFTMLARNHPDNAQAQRDHAASAAKVAELERVVRPAFKVV
jgi:hypothetical protein